jgi:hypothetical protein
MTSVSSQPYSPPASSKPPENEKENTPPPTPDNTEPQTAGSPDSGPRAVQPTPGGVNLGAGQQGAFNNSPQAFEDNGSATPGA